MPAALLAGWLADRFPVRYVLAAGQVCLAVAMAWLLASSGSPELALLYSAWRGASSGLWMVAAEVAWPACFGRRHLGSIRSVGFSVGVAGPALGPVLFGLAYDLLGGYDPAIAALLALPVAAAVAVLLTKPPALDRLEGVEQLATSETGVGLTATALGCRRAPHEARRAFLAPDRQARRARV